MKLLLLGKFCLYIPTYTKLFQQDYNRKPFKNKSNIPISLIYRYDNSLIRDLFQVTLNIVVFKAEIFCENNFLDYL